MSIRNSIIKLIEIIVQIENEKEQSEKPILDELKSMAKTYIEVSLYILDPNGMLSHPMATLAGSNINKC